MCVQNCKLCKCFRQVHYEKVNLMSSPTALLIYFVTFCWMLGDFAGVLHHGFKKSKSLLFKQNDFWKKYSIKIFNSLYYPLFHDGSAILFYGQIHGFDYIQKLPYFPMKLKDNPQNFNNYVHPMKIWKNKRVLCIIHSQIQSACHIMAFTIRKDSKPKE